jgi:two-component system, NtrC family, response regulator PilR
MAERAAPQNAAARTGRSARAARVLVVDDEADLRELLDLTLSRMGLDVDCAGDLAAARALLGRQTYALCLTDMRLPDGTGLELLAEISQQAPATPVAVLTAYGSTENAVAALKAGAFDYLAKPVALESLRSLVRSALGPHPPERGAEGEGGQAVAPIASVLLGESAAMREVRASIERLGRSMAPVALSGESGSGKELAARSVHQQSGRATGPFIAVNCGAIPETLMESEFFGYRKGAFTGAEQDREGFFQAAHGGTLFLDEVADLPLAMQVKLLRAIQEKRVRRVGATTEEPVDVRIISATHQDLALCVGLGRFRQDLYYRLNVIELRMPALRERPEDVGLLCEAMLARLALRAGLPQPPRLASVALKYLQSYAFPGNVRELENILERALAFCNGEIINVEDLGLRPPVPWSAEQEREPHPQPPHPEPGEESGFEAAALPAAGRDGQDGPDRAAAVAAVVGRRPVRMIEGVPDSLPDYLDQIEREAIERALARTRYNRTAAARLLGITFRALRYRMQRLGLN